MDIAKVVLELLGSVFSIWEHKEKYKYYERYVDLKRKYYEENSKPYDQRDAAVLDNIRYELYLLSGSVNSAVARPDAGDESK